MQSGGYDCGLFVIAFATALVHGEQPGRFLFVQDKMRRHLLKCLQEGELTPFPVKKTRQNACRVKSWDTIEVHCVCRMPEVSGIEMIECSNCKTWYHIPFCISVPIEATQARKEWFCPKCKYRKSRNSRGYLIRAYSCEMSQRARIKSHGIFPLHN